jgi:uncharacterized Zn finger protein
MWNRWEKYTPTKPIETRGGIKSKAKGGVNWWSKRWYDFMETFRLGARLVRGRAYARKGQVIGVSVESGLVSGSVQGSRRTPYKVTIRFPAIPEEGWSRIVAALRGQLFLSAQLMAGEVPHELEDFFQKEGASLFPELKRMDDMHCDCPDYSNPCKHIAALFYVLGDAFDRDPFLLLQLRGMTKEALVERLGGVEAATEASAEAGTAEDGLETPETEPLPEDARFFKSPSLPALLALPEDLFGPIPHGDPNMPLLRRLGELPFWRGEFPLMESLQEIYKEAAQRGRAIVKGG